MLVLARKTDESIVVAYTGDLRELVRITVMDIGGGRVKLGIQAKSDLAIHRQEVWERVCGELSDAAPTEKSEHSKYRVPYID
jgi:carbon storage regulator